ncbi:polysaccharide deacetylase family protein [Aquidulcibacter sp.]|uniref:polysaccharide deacetylase family protein n=1 Tax=Aquidulcibacter sp. TaxID=2052990 RepID=UPI0025B887A8|nr:polysaccharide deacetylase family protein [Aquidulcibacter sp.]MCA3695126.1 polysaccharide deacetylase family protein [Aquidulcibacter sp.]
MTVIPPKFSWPNGTKLAVSLVINVEEGAEQNIRDGDKGPEPVDELGAVPNRPMRVYGNESNYQYGIKAGWPRIRDLFDSYNFAPTVTAAALALERAPEIAADIVARKWEVAAHGYRWSHQFWMDEEKERAFITKARDSLLKTTGQRPEGWLSRYLLTDQTRRILAEEGFTYHMDDYSGDMPFWDSVETGQGVKPMLITPYAIDTNDMKMWVAPAMQPWDWAEYAIQSFDALLAEARRGHARVLNIGLHLRIIGRPGRIGALDRVLAHIKAHEDEVFVAGRNSLARAFEAQVPFSP